MQVLVVDPPGLDLPEGTVDLVRNLGWHVTTTADYVSASEVVASGSVSGVILTDPKASEEQRERPPAFSRLLEIVAGRGLAAVVIGPSDDSTAATEEQTSARSPGEPRCLIDRVDPGISPEELRGRLATIARYHKLFRRMERELADMEWIGERLSRHFHEVDREMGLAGRLQRDFLPDLGQPIGNVQFASVYRPASWVSGDIFDVFRIDETNTGLYLADVVGHGMAAGLLTMFIKRAILPKRIEGDRYAVVTPSEAIARLNDALLEQSLPDCQFVTACYGVFNHETRTFRYARGGHPYPIRIPRDGVAVPLKTPGSLLGLFPSDGFMTLETQLQPRDKVLLYTDGVELAMPASESNPAQLAQRVPPPFAQRPIQEMFAHIERQLDRQTGSLRPGDDVTLLGLEVLGD